ncbi:unnamed protein product [Amoebophrya sp. A25]|nr:unnamed protein product [Amoebophrya sp. A25]|eukprot:GSA25T00010002001.1
MILGAAHPTRSVYIRTRIESNQIVFLIESQRSHSNLFSLCSWYTIESSFSFLFFHSLPPFFLVIHSHSPLAASNAQPIFLQILSQMVI